MVGCLQKEIKNIERDIERNRETLKAISLQSTSDYQLAQTKKVNEEIANIAKSISEKTVYWGLQNDEIKLKARILKMLEADLVDAQKDHQDCLNLIEESQLNLTLQQISIQKTQQRIKALLELRQELAECVV